MNMVDTIKNAGVPVIIFGAGIVGEVLLHVCRAEGIMIECFCDNNIHKARSPKCNVEVIHTSDLKARYADAVFLISAADIADVVAQLNGLGYSRWHAGGTLLRAADLSSYRFSAPADFVEFAVGACVMCHENYRDPDALFLRSVDIIITERCSLRCRNCSNLMQYYKDPTDCNLEELLRSIEGLLSLVDGVHEFRVIGGEPFMNKEFHLTVKRLVNEPKVQKIAIYTNGAIIPKEASIGYLKSRKVLVFITDYGKLSRKLNGLTNVLEENGIAYYVQEAQGWTDCARITKHDRNAIQQEALFENCCAKNTITLSNGKLYRCPFSANAARLSAVPDYENDYIDIMHDTQADSSIHALKQKIRKFLLDQDYLETCDYCNGRAFSDPEITPAVQVNKPLEYELYDTKTRNVAGN